MDFQTGFKFKNQCLPLRASKEVWDFVVSSMNSKSVSAPKGSHRGFQAEKAKLCTWGLQRGFKAYKKHCLYLWIPKEVLILKIDVGS